MGQVYRATDTTLGRQVAIKILTDAFASDHERMARFEREAKTLASLNHPNIAAIYGFEKSAGTHALVMELVEGDDLSQRIARGAIPIDEALPIAKQIAEALEAAHEQGIIHRDLKPANIKVRADGTVKVLDFGLAKAMEPVGSSPGLSMSPTITTPAMTHAGMILGTAAYMAPEQARGKTVDKRSDIWAFGCVLYEMLAGKRAFEGEDVSDTLANVLKTVPDWAALPATVPAPLRTLVTLCLEKDRGRRITDVAVARFLLSDTAAVPSMSREVQTISRGRVWRRVLPWAVAGALAVGLVLAVWAPWRTATPSAPLRLEVGLGADASLVTGQGAGILSPDGALFAFVAQRSAGVAPQLYMRLLEQLQATPPSGTDGAAGPFFSPDGQWIGFFAGGRLKKISVTGGAAVTLCDAPAGRGGDWAEDGTITFQPSSGPGGMLLRVSSAGGTPAPLTTLGEGEVTQRWPQVLPGGTAVLYTGSSITGNFDDANLVVQPLPAGARKIVQRGAYHGRYLPSGHLVYIRDGTLFAAPFDLDRLELTGPPAPALEGVTSNAAGGAAPFAVSGKGTLAYLPGQGVINDVPIVWMDREGNTSPLRATPANWANPQFAPDGLRLAMYINDGKQSDVWVYDWARDTLSRFTFDIADDRLAAWTPDGRRIAFASNRADRSAFNLYWQRADGAGDTQRLTESKNNQYITSWHPNGTFLAFHETSPQTGNDLMILPMEGDEASGWKPGKPTVFLNSPFAETWPIFSPDGRWLAYTSNESGRNEVYVRSFPGPGGKWQVSASGGVTPRWSLNRRELLYLAPAPDDRIMVASYTVEGDSFRAEKPRLWADRRLMIRPLGWDFDLHPDGERAALAPVAETQAAARQDRVVFILNFFDELRRVAPLTTR